MKRPKSIKILGFNYRLVDMAPTEAIGLGAEGYCQSDELKIAVGGYLPPIRQVQVVLHESLHAICFGMGMRGEAMDEETVVEKMSDGLLAIWRDNPNLMAWCNHVILQEELRWLADQDDDEDEDDEDEEDDEPEIERYRQPGPPKRRARILRRQP